MTSKTKMAGVFKLDAGVAAEDFVGEAPFLVPAERSEEFYEYVEDVLHALQDEVDTLISDWLAGIAEEFIAGIEEEASEE